MTLQPFRHGPVQLVLQQFIWNDPHPKLLPKNLYLQLILRDKCMNLKDDPDALFHSKMAACAAIFKPMQVAIKLHDQQT